MRLLITILVLFAHSASAQILIRGKIVDSSTKEPLSYTRVVLPDENIATASNNDGYFEIKSGNAKARLQISYLGYDPKSIELTTVEAANDQMIYLTPKRFTLNEFVIRPEKLDKLIKAIYNNYRDKKNQIYHADAFYRDYSTVDNFPVNVSEIFYKVSLNQSGIGDWNFIQGRTAEAKVVVEEPSVDYLFTSINNNSYLMRNFSITGFTPAIIKDNLGVVCISPICENPAKNYVYKRIGEKTIDNKNVAVISFSPRKSNSKFRFYGKFEVIEDDLQVIYLEVALNHKMFFNRIVQYAQKAKRVQYIDSCYFRQVWHYNKFEKDWRLERIENSMKYQARSKTDQSYRKMDIFTSQIYFYNYKDVDSYKLNEQKIKENDRKLIRETKYDPDFWKVNSTALSEVPFEQSIRESFMKNGFYGNLFPGGITPESYPQCSDLENKILRQLDETYYKIFHLFIIQYFYYIPESVLQSLFKDEIRPAYDAYMQQIIYHKIPVDRLTYLKDITKRVSETPDAVGILSLWGVLNPTAVNRIQAKLKQHEKKYNK